MRKSRKSGYKQGRPKRDEDEEDDDDDDDYKGKNEDNKGNEDNDNDNDSSAINGNDHDDKGSNPRKIKKRNISEYDDDMCSGQGRDWAKKCKEL